MQDLDSFDSFPIHNGNVCREKYSKLSYFLYYGFRALDLNKQCILIVRVLRIDSLLLQWELLIRYNAAAAVVIDSSTASQINNLEGYRIILNVRRESGMFQNRLECSRMFWNVLV